MKTTISIRRSCAVLLATASAIIWLGCQEAGPAGGAHVATDAPGAVQNQGGNSHADGKQVSLPGQPGSAGSTVFAVSMAGAEPEAEPGTIWQWSVPMRNPLRAGAGARAYLWVPPDCKRIRAVIIAQHNMEEEMILENPRFRKGMTELGVAEIWCVPMFDLAFDFSRGAGETMDGILDDLTAVSGYSELKFAPFVGLGHSAAANFPYNLAAWKPQRAVACLSVSGQWPYTNTGNAPITATSLNYIPCLETMGEYEAAVTFANDGLRQRAAHPLIPMSMAAGPAQSHFIAAPEKIDYLVAYLKKAMQYRLPDDEPMDAYPKLKPVDPTKTGWLVEHWLGPDRAPQYVPAPVAEYKGPPAQAFWYFDEEMAKATVAYEAAHHGQKLELLGVKQAGEFVPQIADHLQVHPQWLPEADGITFKIQGDFYEQVPPPAAARPSHDWALEAPGTPIGHATGGGPVQISKICGPFEQVADGTFRLALGKEPPKGNGNQQYYEVVFAATHPGDDVYKPSVQQVEIDVRPVKVTGGKAQTITFPAIPDQKAGATIKLKATSDAGVPVYYFVKEGPATLTTPEAMGGNTIKLTAIPPRAKYPVKVTVMAWQYGHAAAPVLDTAEPVERSFMITQ